MELEAEVKDLMQECALRQVGMASESSHMYIGMFFVVSYFRLSISGSSPIQACLHKMGLTLSDTALLASSARQKDENPLFLQVYKHTCSLPPSRPSLWYLYALNSAHSLTSVRIPASHRNRMPR